VDIQEYALLSLPLEPGVKARGGGIRNAPVFCGGSVGACPQSCALYKYPCEFNRTGPGI
jgi:hypothetical protein